MPDSKKIYISRSNQTDNAYAWGQTTEAIQCGRIGDACETALTRCGFQVKNGGGATMVDKVRESNAWGADLHVCIHTNAHNGQTSGTRIFCSGLDNEGGKAARAVFDVLAPFTPGTSENVKVNTGLYEINSTKAYCVYIEVDFHDVPLVAKWIVEHTTEIGETIALGLCNHYGVPYVAPEAEVQEPAQTTEKRYHLLRDVPAVYRPWLDALVDRGLLNGRGGTGDDLVLDMSEGMVRVLVIMARSLSQ